MLLVSLLDSSLLAQLSAAVGPGGVGQASHSPSLAFIPRGPSFPSALTTAGICIIDS